MANRIATMIAPFDELLEGGLELNSLTTIYGPSGSAKTNFCMQCSLEKVREGFRTIYIDCDHGFSTERLRQMTDNYELILANMIFLRPTSFKNQASTINKVRRLTSEVKLNKASKGIGLIVADALTYWYRLELSKSKNVSKLNKDLLEQIALLKEISRSAKIPVVITTPVYSDFESQDQVKIVGGDIIRNNSTTIIELIKLAGANRKAVIQKHRSIAEGKEVMFRIEKGGLA